MNYWVTSHILASASAVAAYIGLDSHDYSIVNTRYVDFNLLARGIDDIYDTILQRSPNTKGKGPAAPSPAAKSPPNSPTQKQRTEQKHASSTPSGSRSASPPKQKGSSQPKLQTNVAKTSSFTRGGVQKVTGRKDSTSRKSLSKDSPGQGQSKKPARSSPPGSSSSKGSGKSKEFGLERLSSRPGKAPLIGTPLRRSTSGRTRSGGGSTSEIARAGNSKRGGSPPQRGRDHSPAPSLESTRSIPSTGTTRRRRDREFRDNVLKGFGRQQAHDEANRGAKGSRLITNCAHALTAVGVCAGLAGNTGGKVASAVLVTAGVGTHYAAGRYANKHAVESHRTSVVLSDDEALRRGREAINAPTTGLRRGYNSATDLVSEGSKSLGQTAKDLGKACWGVACDVAKGTVAGAKAGGEMGKKCWGATCEAADSAIKATSSGLSSMGLKKPPATPDASTRVRRRSLDSVTIPAAT